MDYAQAQAQNVYASQLGAPMIREASLRNRADEAEKYLLEAHGLLNELEDALHGPQPRDGGGGNTGIQVPGHPGLRYMISSNSERAASLVSRLQALIGSL